jgi:IstB-like ATP binding protein
LPTPLCLLATPSSSAPLSACSPISTVIPPACAAAGSATTLAPTLLVIDECGYLSYDAHAADLLFEIVNHRYERNSVLLTTNKAFKDWNTVFPNATSIAALLDRLTHHADVTLIEGTSYRVRESELEAAARKQKKNERESHVH